MAKSDKPELKRAFGTDGNFGEQLGLTKDWVVRIVKAVGNYGEAFDRNVGAGSQLGIDRGSQQSLEQGRPPVRAADPLIAPDPRLAAMSIEARKPPPQIALKIRRVLGGKTGWNGFAVQFAFAAVLGWIAYEIVSNARANLENQHIAAGFGFLANNAGFDVNQTLISYTGSDTFLRVFLVGLLNTLVVSVVGIVFATVIGFIVALCRLSPNWLLSRVGGDLCRAHPQPAAAVPDPVLVPGGARGAAQSAAEHFAVRHAPFVSNRGLVIPQPDRRGRLRGRSWRCWRSASWLRWRCASMRAGRCSSGGR